METPECLPDIHEGPANLAESNVLALSFSMGASILERPAPERGLINQSEQVK
jgi:hypothetical protein